MRKRNKRIIFQFVLCMIASIFAGGVSAEPRHASNEQLIPAFPGAEGGGMYTSGGRGGEVYKVTTLADAGPGSLRDAVSESNRTIIFDVGGVIQLESPLKIAGSNLTIAGQTAPGDGITVMGYPTVIEGNNIIIRYMRFRLGDANMTEADAFGGRYLKDIIIDHCSFSWSVDEVLSVYGSENVTIQWSIIADAMHLSRHAKGKHGYGGIWGGKNTSFHHNLIAHNSSRNPAFDSTAGNTHDFQNNVIYNWGYYSAYGGKEAETNLINNYYKPGPETERIRFMNAETDGSYYIAGNVMEGYPEYTDDNWEAVHKYPDYKVLDAPVVFDHPLTPYTAEEAYHDVLEQAGAVLPKRDPYDARIINDVRNRTGTHINSQIEAGGYPDFPKAISELSDSDGDGMPDDWELQHHLDPDDPNDRNKVSEDGYTYLEKYLHSITGNGSQNPEAEITSPVNNAIIEAGSDVMIEAAASDPDGKVEKVEFYLNGEKIGEDDEAPYRMIWNQAVDGTHYLAAKVIDDSGTSTFSANVTVHVNTKGDIAPWESIDIGSPGIPGHVQLGETESDVVVKSAGDINGSSDSFHYAYQLISGNAEITARIEHITPTNSEAEAGLMFRESLSESSPFAAIVIPYIRSGMKGVTLSRAEDGENALVIEPNDEFQLPYWAKIVRLGDQFTALVSEDGEEWKVVGSVHVNMPDTIYAGLVADASKGNNEAEKYNTSVFSNVSIHSLSDNFPLPPSNLKTVPGESKITLSWDPVENADYYNVLYSQISGGPYLTVVKGLLEPSFTHEELTSGMIYCYVATAVNEHGESFQSDEICEVPEGELETIYYIQEDYESMPIGTTPDGYVIFPDPQDEDHTVTVAEVPSDSSGNFSEKALKVYDNGAGNAYFSLNFPQQTGAVVFEFDFMSPSVPGTSALLHVKDSDERRTPIMIEIRKPQVPELEDEYTLVYKNKYNQDVKLMEPPQNNKWHNIKIAANAASGKMDIYIDNELAAKQVEIKDDMSELGFGTAVFGRTPGTGRGTLYFDNIQVYVEPVTSPKGLQAIPGNGKVQLHWEEAAGALGYTVKRSTTDGGPYETIAADLSASTVTFIDADVVNGTTYYYVVTAIGDQAESGFSNQVSATPSENAVKPEAPEKLTATASHTQVELTWEPVDFAISYTVKRSEHPEGPFEKLSDVSDPFFRDTGLVNGTQYFYVVSAVSAAGEGKESAPAAARPVTPLQAPTDLAAVAGDASATILWEPVSEAKWYQIKRSTVDGGPYETVAERVVENHYHDAGLDNGTVYYYVVSAHNETSLSANSDAVRAIPHPSDLAAPPNDVSLEVGEDYVLLSWSDVPEATSYTIKRAESRDGDFAAIASHVEGAGYIDLDVTAGKTYYYSVHSVNANGEGVGSFPQGASPAVMITVAKDGSGDYDSVQEAVDSIPEGNAARTIIYIRDGVYEEQITIPKTKHAISFIGESKENTILTYTGITGTGFNEPATTVESDDFIAKYITFSNGAGDQGPGNALHLLGDRAYLSNVRLVGYQDTLFTHHDGDRVYVKDSYIEGAVDFIYGGSIAVFDQCVIYNVRSGGYVTAASTPEHQEYGYLFVNSRITGDNGIDHVYLGRPWRPFSHVVFMNSEFDQVIHPAGWHNWGNADNEKTARYYEFNNFGPGSDPNDRVAWSKQLTPEEANRYAIPAMMRGADGWDPLNMPALPLAVVSVDHVITLVERFAQTGEIDNAGIANSLTKKLENGNFGSFMNQVRAQRGKHITDSAAEILLKSAEKINMKE